MTFDERVATYLETGEWDPDWGPVPPELAAVRQQLAEGATWTSPPAEGLDRLLDAVAHERDGGAPDADTDAAAIDGVPGDRAAAPVGPARPAGRARHRRKGVAAWLGAAATLAVAVAAVLVVVDDSGRPDAHDFELAGTDVVPGAAATGMVWSTGSGEWFELEVSGLPPADADEYYAGWVRGDTGVVSIGTFHARDDDTIHLWSGVPVEDYPDVTITRQLVAEGPDSSGEVVLEGRVPAG